MKTVQSRCIKGIASNKCSAFEPTTKICLWYTYENWKWWNRRDLLLRCSGWYKNDFFISLILETQWYCTRTCVIWYCSHIVGRRSNSPFSVKSAFNIQSNLTPTCNISKNYAMAKILQQCKLIVWDKCTMAHNKIFGGNRQNYERFTFNASGWTQCMFNFWPI